MQPSGIGNCRATAQSDGEVAVQRVTINASSSIHIVCRLGARNRRGTWCFGGFHIAVGKKRLHTKLYDHSEVWGGGETAFDPPSNEELRAACLRFKGPSNGQPRLIKSVSLGGGTNTQERLVNDAIAVASSPPATF